MAATLVVLTVVLTATLRRSGLTSALDASVRTRADDLALSAERADLVSRHEGAQGWLVVVVGSDGSVELSTDALGDPAELQALPSDEVVRTVPLGTYAATKGSERMRLVGLPPASDAATIYVGRTLRDVDASIDNLQRLLVVSGLTTWALFVGLIWLVTGQSLAPVEAMRREVEAFSVGDPRQRLARSGAGDEIDRLADTMNDLLDRLDRSARRQRQFVADASHELRSPLAAIRSQLEVGIAHPRVVDWPGVAATATVEARRMQDLIDDLLFLAQGDAGQRPTRHVAVDLDDIVLETVHAVVRPQHVALDCREVSAGAVSGDAAQLARVVRNLVENAYRYTADSVRVALRNAGDDVVLVVADNGPGVPVAERARIFERFVRLDEARARNVGGTGLGLAIAREIVEEHGGMIDVGDARPGARFEVRLPRAA